MSSVLVEAELKATRNLCVPLELLSTHAAVGESSRFITPLKLGESNLCGTPTSRRLMSLSLFSACSGLVLPSSLAPQTVSRASAARMACVEEFSISREIKSVRIFDGAPPPRSAHA